MKKKKTAWRMALSAAVLTAVLLTPLGVQVARASGPIEFCRQGFILYDLGNGQVDECWRDLNTYYYIGT
jgi:ABC-type sugar transport system substrate-binding protein